MEEDCSYALAVEALLARGGTNTITPLERFFHESGLPSGTKVSAAINSYAQWVKQILKQTSPSP